MMSISHLQISRFTTMASITSPKLTVNHSNSNTQGYAYIMLSAKIPSTLALCRGRFIGLHDSDLCQSNISSLEVVTSDIIVRHNLYLIHCNEYLLITTPSPANIAEKNLKKMSSNTSYRTNKISETSQKSNRCTPLLYLSCHSPQKGQTYKGEIRENAIPKHSEECQTLHSILARQTNLHQV